jgi:hypothetical protein
LAVSLGAKYHQGADDCEAGYRDPLAPRRIQIVLALDIAALPRRTSCTVGIRRLIREMSIANPLWGAPRTHGELLKLGIDIGQTSVAKYMARRRGPPSQGCKTFIRNHADGIVANGSSGDVQAGWLTKLRKILVQDFEPRFDGCQLAR